ncbi:hypothetical protein GCM10010359_31980 [Streptomyces morookaense]|nr:hypothetical protein GCM10010359_31980 [Streptomyces morookaense]
MPGTARDRISAATDRISDVPGHPAWPRVLPPPETGDVRHDGPVRGPGEHTPSTAVIRHVHLQEPRTAVPAAHPSSEEPEGAR